MKTILKHIVSHTYKPLLEKYLSKTRTYRHNGIDLTIPPEVFHPGFFFSTGMLLQYIEHFPLSNKRLLELGAGSGLISMRAARKGATVTATDINPVAVDYLQKNSKKNKIDMAIILSDLFKDIPGQAFDIIVINPPYYKKDPQTLIDHAWYCGENGEYFSRLFYQLGAYMHANSIVLMTLCEGCDREMIKNAVASNHFSMRCVQTKQTVIEKNFIYKIEKKSNPVH
jgi:release factor glutamine methyltransferase